MIDFTVHAGHNPDGLIANGAVGFLKESTCAREIVTHLESMLTNVAFVKNVTVNDGTSQNDILRRLTKQMNDVKPYNCNISIHLNAHEDASINGVECLIYPGNEEMKKLGQLITEKLGEIGYKQRPVKERGDLYILKNTKESTIIIECGFATNKHDAELYDARMIAERIFLAVAGFYGYDTTYVGPEHSDDLEYVQIGAFSNHENALKMLDMAKQAGFVDAFIKK